MNQAINTGTPDRRFYLTGRLLTYALPVFAVFGIAVPLLLGKTSLFVLGCYLTVPVGLAPLLFLALRRRKTLVHHLGTRAFQLMLICFMLSFAAAAILLKIDSLRPYTYYMLIAVMITVVAFEALGLELNARRVHIIITQMMMLMAISLYGVNLKYFFFIGRTDPPAHAWYLENLLRTGHVDPAIFAVYQPFPLWHILCSFVYQVIDLNWLPIKVMFLTCGIIYAFLIPTIFLMASKVFKSQRYGLLTAMFLLVNPDILMSGMSALARSIVSFLLVLAIYLLLNYNFQKAILSIILIFALIIYHPASMPFIMTLFVLIYAFQRFYQVPREQWAIRGNYLLLLLVTTLSYWVYCSRTLFSNIIFNLVMPAMSGTMTKITIPLNELFNYLEYAPVLFFIVFGVIWGLYSRRFNPLTRVFLVIGLLMVLVSFPGPLLLFNKLSDNLNLDRFSIYAYIFTSMAAAVGIAGIYYKFRQFGRPIVLILVCLLAFLSVSNDFDASDHPLVKRAFYTFYLTQSEYTGVRHLASLTTENNMMADYVVFNYLAYCTEYGANVAMLQTDQKGTRFLRGSPNDILCIREAELEKRPLSLFDSVTGKFINKASMRTTLNYFYNNAPLYQTLDGYSKIYDDQTVTAYL